MNKIIIDADPGVDDAFAIILAGMSKSIDLLGVTVVGGNCGIKNGIRNAFKCLNLCNRDDVPVFKGAKDSLKVRFEDAAYVHGINGFGDLEYKSIRRFCKGNAIKYLIKEVNRHPGEIDVVAVGPLTNIALAILKDKNFAKNLRSLIIMGGAVGKGNVTEYAEFNFYKDPHAAKIVFDSEIKEIVMLGLDVTTKLPLAEKYENYLENHNSELARILYKITRLGAAFDRKCGHDGLILNDPLTIAYLINPNVVELKKAIVSIEINGEEIGKSYVKLNDLVNCKVAYKVNPELFYQILFDTVIEKKY